MVFGYSLEINSTFLPAVSLPEGFFDQISEKPVLFARMQAYACYV